MGALELIILFIFALIGAPLFAIFGAASLVLFGGAENGTIISVAVDVFSERFADSPTLVTLPLFTFAGYLMAESGTPKRLVAVSRAWFGWMPGGLAMVCLAASAFFTTFTGGSGITIVAIGGLLYPALLSDKYPERFSLGLVTTGGSLGLLFPPSLPLILYAVVAQVLIDKIFLAGLVPGAVVMAALAVYAAFVGVKSKIPRTKFKLDEALKTLWEAKWEAALPFGLLGGLATGLLRIHEASAFTALYVLVVEVFIYKDIDIRKDLPRVIRESMTMLGAILAILSTALGFTGFLIQARVPELMVEWMESFISEQWMFLLALNVFLLVVGMLMDIFSAIVVVVPLIVPIAEAFGVNPYHLGIVFLLNLEIGYLTPPVGLNLFISSFRFNKPVTQLYKAVLPYIGLLVIALAITTYIPELSTTLTSLIDAEEVNPNDVPDDGMDDPGGGIGLDDLDDEGFDDGLGLDDLGDDDLTLDDLGDDDGATLDDMLGDDGEGETLDDMLGDPEGETLEDMLGDPPEGETLDDL